MDLIITLNTLDNSTLLPLLDIETLIKLYLNSNLLRVVLERAVYILCKHHQLPLVGSFKEFVSTYDYLRLSERTSYYAGMSQALIRACGAGHLSLIESLMVQGAPITEDSMTEAARSGHCQILKTLMSKAPKKDIWKTVDIAFEKGHTDIIEFVLQEYESRYIYTAINAACRGGRSDIVKKIKEVCNHVAPLTGTAIQESYYSGNSDMIQYVLSQLDPAGTSINHLALKGSAGGGHLDVFMSCSHDNIYNMERCLLSAVTSGNIDIINTILSKYQPSHIEIDNAANTASLHGHKKIVHMMLDRGCNNLERCAHHAAMGGYLDIVELIISRGAANYNDIMITASFNGHIHIVRAMLERDATNYSECLEDACINGYLDIIRLMLSKGATVTEKAILNARDNHHVDILRILQE